jgi:hypothetical protein
MQGDRPFRFIIILCIKRICNVDILSWPGRKAVAKGVLCGLLKPDLPLQY